MEKVKELIRFCQIHKDLDFHLPHEPFEWLKRFDEFCEKGEKVWIEQNLFPNNKRRFLLLEEERSHARFERINSIHLRFREESDFQEFFQDEKAWVEKQELDE